MRTAKTCFVPGALALAAALAACGGGSSGVAPAPALACATSTDCSGGLICDPATHSCVTSAPCSASSCPGGACWGTVCRTCGVDVVCPIPSNTCPSAAAPILDLSSGSALIMGSFEGLTYAPSWAGPGRGGAIKFTLTQETILSGWMTKTSWLGGPSDSLMAILRDDCADVVARSVYQGGREVLPERYLAPGTYYVFVWGDLNTLSYLASLTAVAAAQPQGNTCASPLPLTWDAASGAVAIPGSTASMRQCTRDACADVSGDEDRQRVYRLVLPVRSYVDLQATYPVALGLNTDCWGKWACNPSKIQHGPFGTAPLDAGTYYVVASSGTTERSYDITGNIRPWPTNESCAAATAIDLSGGTASIWGDVAYAGSGTPTACTSTNVVSSKLVYVISTEGVGEQSLDVTLDAAPYAAHGLVLHRACESTALADVVACDPYTTSGGTLARLTVDALTAGQYWLSVGDGDAAGGEFALTVTRGPPRYAAQANDTCSSPEVITVNSNTPFVRTGDTRGALDDASGTCGGAATGAGRDVVYRIVTSGRGHLDLQLVPGPGFDGVLRLDPGCTSAPSASQPCANASGPGGAEALSFQHSGAQTDVWVDGANGTAGPFTLQVQETYPASNEQCVSAIPSLSVLTLGGASLTGDLTNAWADAAGGCLAALPELWYAFTNTGGGPTSVAFTVQPSGFDAVVRVLTDCAQAVCPPATDAGGAGVAETTPAVTVKGGGSVWIEVTGNGPGGPFSIAAHAP